MASVTRTTISLLLAVLCTVSTCMHAFAGDVLCIEQDGRTAIENSATRSACCDSRAPASPSHDQSMHGSHACLDVPLVPHAVVSHSTTLSDVHFFLCTIPSDLPQLAVTLPGDTDCVAFAGDVIPRISLPQQSVRTFVILI